MNGKVGAYGKQSKNDTGFRKEWSQEEWTEKAKEKDREAAERAVEVEEALKQGKKAPRRKVDLPKATQLMQAREGPLDLDKNLNKTIIVNPGATSGQTQAGFYCDICRRTNKDSVAYLDHINGRSHLRRLGQTTKVIKSTLNDVRQKIADLRAQTAAKTTAKAYDFDQRIKEIKALEIKSRDEARKRKKEEKVMKAKKALEELEGERDQDMMAAMGFGNFGAPR